MAPWVFWLAVVIVLGIVEAATVNLVTIWFVASGIVSLIISLFTDSFVICFAVFVLLGVVLLICTRPLIKKYSNGKHVATNIDRIVGMQGSVTQEITPKNPGEVKADGKLWTAVSDETLQVGSFVEILQIDGVKLIVRSI